MLQRFLRDTNAGIGHRQHRIIPLLLQMDDKACTVPSSNARRFNTQSMPLQRGLSSPSAHMSMLLSDADFLWPGGHAALP